MRQTIKIIRSITDAIGSVACRNGLQIPVHFDLLETQESPDGKSSPSFSVGNLRYEPKCKRALADFLRFHTRLILHGGGIEAAIFLYPTDQFTVMNTITILQEN